MALARTFSGREARRLAGHDGHARGEGPHAIGDLVGLAVHDPDAPIVDAQRIGANLRDHGLDALPDRGRAGDDLDSARCIDRDPHPVERTEAAFFDEHAKPDTDRFAGLAPPLHVGPQLRPVHGGQRLVEQSSDSRRNRT